MTGTAGTAASAPLPASPSATRKPASSPAALDQVVAAVAEQKRAFACLSVDERIALLRAIAPLL